MYSFSRPKQKAYIKDNTFVFNGINLSDYVAIESIKRALIPERHIGSIAVPGMDGVHTNASQYGTRQIELEIRFVEDTFKDVLDKAAELALKLHSTEAKSLLLRDAPYINYAMLESADTLTNHLETGSTTLTFVCYDPFNYSVHEVETTPGLTTTINNPGYYTPVEVIFTTADATESLYTVTHNGKVKIKFTKPASATVPITIKLVNNKIRIVSSTGSSLLHYLTIDSDPFLLKPGVNTVSSPKNFKLKYRNRWL